MKIKCEIKQFFSMIGENDSCQGIINFSNQEIFQTEEKEFFENNFNDSSVDNGLEYFQVEFELLNNYYEFRIIKTNLLDVFEISELDKNNFLDFVNPLLLQEKLNNTLLNKPISKKAKI